MIDRCKPACGRSTVLNLAKRGVNSIFTFHSNRAEAEKVVAAVGETDAKAVALQVNTGNVGAFDAFVIAVRSALGGFGAERFDYLVNNAGISHHNSFDKTTEAELDDLYSLQGRILPDAKASAAYQGWRADRESFDGLDPCHDPRDALRTRP